MKIWACRWMVSKVLANPWSNLSGFEQTGPCCFVKCNFTFNKDGNFEYLFITMDENWRLYFLQHSSFCSLKNHSVHYCPKIYILTILALSLCDNVFLIPAFWLLIVQLQSLRVGEVWEETVLGEHFPRTWLLFFTSGWCWKAKVE